MAEHPATPDGEPTVRGPRLVGRSAELRRTVHALTAAAPATVLIEGEAGIGKTRLLQEALAQPALAGALVAGCPPFREPLTLAPVVDAVRQARTHVTDLGLSSLAGALRPLFPEWADTLPPAPEPLDDAGAARHRLFRALHELLAGCATTVLVVEDAHWADPATLDFLLFLATRPAAHRISLVLTYRPEDVPSGSQLLRLTAKPTAGTTHLRIVLHPLTVAHTGQLVSSMLHDEHVSGAFASFLHEHTAGLPLAVEESVRLLSDRADLIRRNGEWRRRTLTRIAVPPTIRDAVLEGAARLAPDARRVLRAAAVLAEGTEPQVVVAVSGLPADRGRSALAAAVRARALVEEPTGRVRFRHLLAARAVYDDIPGGERRAFHLRAGRALEALQPIPIARLPHHFGEAGDTEGWRHYTELAADLALASGDQPSAVTALHALLSSGGLPAGAVVRMCRKFPVYAFSGYLLSSELLQVLRALLDGGALARTERGEVRAQLGRMLLHAGQYANGAAELERALADLDDRPHEAASAMSALGRPGGADWPVTAHRRWLEKSTGLVEARVRVERRLPFRIDRLTALLEMGDPSGWDLLGEITEDADGTADILSVIRADLNIGDAALRWGFYPEARRRLLRAVDLAEGSGHLRLRDMAGITLAHLDWFSGAWQGLAERLAAFTVIEAEPLIALESLLLTALLTSATSTNPAELAAADERLGHVLAEAGRRGFVELPLEPTAALAATRLAGGRGADALALTEEGMRVVTRKGIWLWATEIAPVRVQALTAAGRTDEADALVTRYARGLRGCTALTAAASLAVCRALVGDAREPAEVAADRWEAAAAAWDRLPRPHAALLARERQARALAAAGHAGRAADLLARVEAGLRDLGAHHDAARLAAPARLATPVRQRGRSGRRGYGDQLSPRELEVVRLMLTGLSTPDIARSLSRSPKTVAAQLNSAMRKHQVNSRTALAVAALRAGVTPAEPAAEPPGGAEPDV
ncbi:putative LuxR family transcriptional regulator [Actinacidiphila reveromycinica]|uniref:Putative LuxR family transcriptional regulator n=1 Tax=Actinacidiphila reveromycinica TaxID=659352 RepID=A0A7U3V0A6_9ACTN|nr:AAA family ATPase [Streptomyces sp. SN-593]BBB01912.1 putative LuxR family transcriptional regulator [Streptomyces sp. SN-593]